ncbi:MAG: prolipoprotein diacylglyceryl transferase [Acidimicrobiia bacterium]|nr:prolipoprotein diacylglyceryl transferase [Acidimicrobiia bacterium]MDH3462286.1 prolipoprotein diacylglyceryl transferase [Acidimicrobiia bacterium]
MSPAARPGIPWLEPGDFVRGTDSGEQIPMILASFPSPPINGFHIGPLRVTFYGVLIAIGVALAWQVTEKRFSRTGGDIELLGRVLGRVVIFGFLGARLAYVSTHLSRFEGEWWKVIALWEGGLALYGGLAAGAITLVVYARKWGLAIPDLLDSMAPAVPLAQAIGRWGNYFNQELFGTPTDLPWGVEIDPVNRPEAFPDASAFHPTFLYESLWNIALAASIIWAGNRFPRLGGRLIGIYFLGYGMIRFGLEAVRTDTTFRFLGLSRNGWVSIGVMIVGLVVAGWKTRAKAGAGHP